MLSRDVLSVNRALAKPHYGVFLLQMHDAQLEEHLSGSRYVFLPSAPRASVDTHATHASKFVPIAKPTPLCDRRPASALAM